jgi:hypothetical protein
MEGLELAQDLVRNLQHSAACQETDSLSDIVTGCGRGSLLVFRDGPCCVLDDFVGDGCGCRRCWMRLLGVGILLVFVGCLIVEIWRGLAVFGRLSACLTFLGF